MTTRLLFVEDESDLLDIVCDALEFGGIQVTRAANGAEALACLRSGAIFDAVVSDMAMPGQISGIDIAQEAAITHPGARFILATGHPRSQFTQLPEHVRFLRKPYRVRELLEMLAIGA